jgi:hypothetical protein
MWGLHCFFLFAYHVIIGYWPIIIFSTVCKETIREKFALTVISTITVDGPPEKKGFSFFFRIVNCTTNGKWVNLQLLDNTQ